MWVLAHLENFNLSSLQLDISRLHLPLAHNLDSNFLVSFLVSRLLNQAEFALAQSTTNVVEVEQIGIPDNLFDRVHPLLLILLRQQVVHPLLIVLKDQLERMQSRSIVQFLLILVFDEDADQRMHRLVLFFLLRLINVQFFP